MLKTLKRRSLNWVGDQQGYGGCNRCGDRWSWKKLHNLELASGIGCFPLCEECWKNTTKEEKLAYYLHHVYMNVSRPQFDFQAADANIRRQINEYYDSLRPTVTKEEER